ncbi:metallophosphoesterase [Candidatus Bathyarchaeota archaeon]|nr:metallophosphoesterase [Candidatus Bathyarchaeota archaeon]
MLIAHISDLHCGHEFQPSVFQQAAQEINSLDPDVVVITGDLTDSGLLSQYREAKKRLDSLRCRNLVATSGNHDYRSTGYLLFKQAFGFRRIVKIDDTVMIVVGTARPERDEGEIGHRQVVWLQQTLRRYKRKRRVVIMHHHLVQVPDTGPDTIPIIDSGDALRALITSKADLVLGGHRHRPWMWNVQNLPILHAGSLSSERLRGFFHNSYNIVELRRSEIETRLKVVGGRSISFKEVLEKPLGIRV